MKNNPLLFLAGPAGLMMWTGILMSLLCFSCGRKALPLPPDAYIPPAVKDLTATFEAGSVLLTWIVPDGRDHQKKGLSEMVVYQAEKSASCPDCPLPYAPVATIPAAKLVENGGTGLKGTCALTVAGKGPFFFYVVACSKTGAAGPKSDIVNFYRPAEEP